MFYDGTVHIEEDDQCYKCEYFCKSVMCPLLEALATGVARLDGDVVVKNCGFYVEFKRLLSAVPGHTPANSTEKPKRRRKPKNDA